jgi:hypothetical protein
MVKNQDRNLDVHIIIAQRICLVCFHFICLDFFLLRLPSKPRAILSLPCYIPIIFLEALVVRIEPNGSQALLSHDDVVEDLKVQGWDAFIKRFEDYNLHVAKEFAQTFDGYREKIGYIQLEVIEDFVSEVIGLPSTGEKWFKKSNIQ